MATVDHLSRGTAESLTDERGKHYGSPLKHFACTRSLFIAWEQSISEDHEGWCSLTPEQQEAVKHGVYMILDKLARASEDPKHMDNWDDIQGYSKCIKECIGND